MLIIITTSESIMSIIRFDSWGGENGIEQFIKDQTGCKPYSGAGINPRPRDRTTILRSVDDTYYYDDDLSNSERVKYTLFGHNGDQDVNERKFNEPFLNKDKTTHIYLYRVKPHSSKKNKNEYLWYGKYELSGMHEQIHPGKDYINRKIIIVSLKKV